MILDQNWLEIGIVDRVHGLQGAVVVRFSKSFSMGSIAKLNTLFIQSGETKVPYSIVRSSPPTQSGMVVWLEDVNHRDQAQRLLGNVAYIPMPKKNATPSKSTLDTLSDYKGFRVELVDQNPIEGAQLFDVQQLPGQIMLEIEESWGRWLCPYQPSFIKSVDPLERIILLDPPGGLRELYQSDHEN